MMASDLFSYSTLALAILIAVLLIIRLRRQNRVSNAMDAIKSTDFARFLHANSVDGSIQDVAGMVSDILKSAFGCSRIVFLRKKRGLLELNYFHGLNKFDRRDFNIPFKKELSTELMSGFIPRSVSDIVQFLPSPMTDILNRFDLNLFFPVFWRGNLYGVYFVQNLPVMKAHASKIMLASLAQSLSAAYHVKWHETRQEYLQKRLDSFTEDARREDRQQETAFSSVLRLVKERNPETLVVGLVDSLLKDLGLTRIAFLYEQRGNGKAALIVRGEDNRTLKIPGRDSLNEILSTIDDRSSMKIEGLAERNAKLEKWSNDLLNYGLRYLTLFPFSAQRSGALAWTGTPVESITRRLEFLKNHIRDLFDNAESYEKIEELSYTDGLTGLSNQRYFLKRLGEEIARCRRYNRKLSLVFFDLDDLKTTNDTYGHLAGDDVLRQMGTILKNCIRSNDVISRYGGDEFCVIMPESDEQTCVKFMQRLQSKVAESKFKGEGINGNIKCTISLGGAVFPSHAMESKKLVYAADMALLKAKESGRDRFLLSSEIVPR